MSKIICDVCGTSYPDTATQCPICGCVRPGDAQSVPGDTADKDSGNYTYVKGGRFSKSNVRKRNKANAVVSVNVVSDAPKNGHTEKRTSAGLVIAAVVLLLAIIAVVIYIALRFFMPDFIDPGKNDTSGAMYDTTGSVMTTEGTVPCEGITLDVEAIMLDKKGSARMLYVTVQPDNVTDEVIYTSDNEDVVAVSADGKVTAVGSGTANITVSCGQFSAKCIVECTFEEATVDTTAETTDATTDSTAAANTEFMLNRKDITFGYKGESWMIYDGSVGLTDIKWSTDNEAVATIENGKVVAAGPGMTTVYAEYDGTKVSCVIRCNFTDESQSSGVGGTGGVTEDGGGVSEDGGTTNSGTPMSGSYKLYNPFGNAEDVSIKTGESFSLQLVDGSGNQVSGASWSSSNDKCSTVSGGTITGVSPGIATITATLNGQSYSCTVRVG